MVVVPGRGEFFIRRHRHPDPAAPTVLLLHGWTASSDLQFIAAYRELAEVCSFIGIDHRGHGRGLRTVEAFQLEDVADDAAAVLRTLGVGPVIAVGYSMGGPIAMLLTRRHRELVAGLVVQATALEWSATRRERLAWKLLPLMGAALRSWAQPLVVRRGLPRIISDDNEFAPYRGWLAAEASRNDPHAVIAAGRALNNYDARPWASSLGVPAAMLVSTRDRLVKPRKQRALAAALDAYVVEVAMDHLGALEQPDQFSSATAELVSSLAGELSPGAAGSIRAANAST